MSNTAVASRPTAPSRLEAAIAERDRLAALPLPKWPSGQAKALAKRAAATRLVVELSQPARPTQPARRTPRRGNCPYPTSF